MTTIIIGAGASGLACAISLKRSIPDSEVIVLERLGTAGKKLLATGNGRCNFTNMNASHSDEVIAFFNSIGLKERVDEEGRVYPYSNQAATVLEVLENACRELGVEIITDCTVKSVDRDMCVITDCGIFMADNVVVAAGGRAQPSLGSDGSGYALLRSFGHTITPLSPALVQLTSSSKYPRMLKGSRAKCSMKILLDFEEAGSDYGEVLFTDYGLSGIVTMNLSSIVSRNFSSQNVKKCHAVLDLTPDISEQELATHLEQFGNLNGILGSKLYTIIDKQAQGDKSKIVKYVKSWQLIITGTKGFDFAQITSGGAKSDEFEQFRSKLADGLYACGEVLDEQFECGGYNLNFAFYSGIKTADRIAGK